MSPLISASSRTAFLLAAGVAMGSVMGCTAQPRVSLDARVRDTNVEISQLGLAESETVKARLAELDSAIERESGDAWVEKVEVRAATSYDNDDRVELLARVPLPNPFEIPARRDALHADSVLALARVNEAMLQERVARCLPALEQESQRELQLIYDAYALRQKRLLRWSNDLAAAGQIDDVKAARFALASEVDLRARAPRPIAGTAASQPQTVLPNLIPTARFLDRSLQLVREQLLQYQPAMNIHSAIGQRYEALARRQDALGWPSLKFIDFSVEPVVRSGEDREYGARVAVEIPLGNLERSRARSYRAMARSETHEGLTQLNDRIATAFEALTFVDEFERSAPQWMEIVQHAQDAEELSDRWWRGRLAQPDAIARLLDEVFAARNAALNTRRRAGIAACNLLTETGVALGDWPRL
ncbi:MAG: hypothetical protein ACI8TX_000835 [Hyphomicrobiaceae bacterium]|jgi:hypothetical protein